MNSSFLGIAFAISGNILISVSLNLQKYAHNSVGSNQMDQDSESSTLLESENREFSYLKNRLWWLGVLIMTVGEAGNFVAYAFASASVIAPLGTFALMSNTIIAPFALNERIRTRDICGIVLSVFGSVLIVSSSNQQEKQVLVLFNVV